MLGCVVVFDAGVFGRPFRGRRKRRLAGLGDRVWQNGLVLYTVSWRSVALLTLVARC